MRRPSGMGVRRNFSRWGYYDHYAYPFQLAGLAMQMDVHKKLSRFYYYTPKKMPLTSTRSIRLFEILFKWGVYTSLPQGCTFCHPLQLLLNWHINIVNSIQLGLLETSLKKVTQKSWMIKYISLRWKIPRQLCLSGQGQVAKKSWIIKNTYSAQWIQATLCFSGQAQVAQSSWM